MAKKRRKCCLSNATASERSQYHNMLWVLLCWWLTAFVYLYFYSAEAHDPTISSGSSEGFSLSIFSFVWQEWRRMSGEKLLERIRLPSSSAHWSQCRSALIPAWNMSHHHPSCASLPDPSNTKTCTQVRQINGFNLDNSSLSICGVCWPNCSSLGITPSGEQWRTECFGPVPPSTHIPHLAPSLSTAAVFSLEFYCIFSLWHMNL